MIDPNFIQRMCCQQKSESHSLERFFAGMSSLMFDQTDSPREGFAACIAAEALFIRMLKSMRSQIAFHTKRFATIAARIGEGGKQ